MAIGKVVSAAAFNTVEFPNSYLLGHIHSNVLFTNIVVHAFMYARMTAKLLLL
jgi:hypothetical protein